jgi:hypothetical protein
MAKGDTRKKARANNLGQSWWRKLSLPRRGKKETLLAPRSDEESRALPAAHAAKISKRTAKLRKAIDMPRTARLKHLTVADWDGARAMARVVTPRGNAVQSMGVFIDGAQWLFPEEAVYLVDRAQLDMRVDGVPASLQRAWALMLEGPTAITLDQYCAFAHLRRIGYVVRRPHLDKISDTDDDPGPSGKHKDGDEGSGNGNAVYPAAVCDAHGVYEHDLEAQPPLDISFSVWRVGAFRRKETHRPLFNLIVCRYEDELPRHAQVAALLAKCTGKTRLRAALIDRGVVVLVDLANNATPLSSRYLNRLAAKTGLKAGGTKDATGGLPLGNGAVSAEQCTVAIEHADENGFRNAGGNRNDVASMSLRDVDLDEHGKAHDQDTVASGMCLAQNDSEILCREVTPFFGSVADAVESLFSQRNRIEFHEITKCVSDRQSGTSGPWATTSHVKLALEEMARRDMVVLSSDNEPSVFAVTVDCSP